MTANVRRDDGIYTVSYSYDGANNRISEMWTDGQNYIVSQTSFTYQSGSYLDSKYGTTGTAYYTWNTVGQLSTKVDNGSTQTHLFNGMGHLSGVSKDGIVLEVYTYDALGRRLKVSTNGEITLNFSLGNDSGYEVKKNLSTGYITTTKYVSVNGQYLAKTVQENGGTEQKYFYHVDMVGSIRAITDMSGQVTTSYEYEPFGLVVVSDGEDNDNLGFAGKRLDGTGLSYFGGRYYDAEIGRFISRDPVFDGRNWFVYCANNPLIYIDPTGFALKLEELTNPKHPGYDQNLVNILNEINGDYEDLIPSKSLDIPNALKLFGEAPNTPVISITYKFNGTLRVSSDIAELNDAILDFIHGPGDSLGNLAFLAGSAVGNPGAGLHVRKKIENSLNSYVDNAAKSFIGSDIFALTEPGLYYKQTTEIVIGTSYINRTLIIIDYFKWNSLSGEWDKVYTETDNSQPC